MFIYNYDEITHEFKNKQHADIDPEESKVQGKEVYLIPANATTEEPPITGDNEAAIFENGWQIESDYRGLYMVNSEMRPVKVNFIGDLPLGYAIITTEQIKIMLEKGDYYYVIQDGQLIVNPDYEEEKARRERERINRLSLTKREVFLALYKAKNITPDMLKAQITNPESLIEFEYANDYFRGNPLIDTIGGMLGYSSADLDYLFEHKEFPEVQND